MSPSRSEGMDRRSSPLVRMFSMHMPACAAGMTQKICMQCVCLKMRCSAELVWDLHLTVEALWYPIHCICLRVAAAELWASRIPSACDAFCMLGTDSICTACLCGRSPLCFCLIAAACVCVYVYYSMAPCVMCACMFSFGGFPPSTPSGAPYASA